MFYFAGIFSSFIRRNFKNIFKEIFQDMVFIIYFFSFF